MTTLTTILGLVPMSLGIGEGAELQAPLARVVIGGLAASTLVTLVLVPAVYTLFEEGLTGLRRGSAPVAPGASLDDHEKADWIRHSPRGRRRRLAWYYVKYGKPPKSRRSTTPTISQGDIIEAVTSTGTLEPLRRFDVGSQVSGTVKEIYVDFNSHREEGPAPRGDRSLPAAGAGGHPEREHRAAEERHREPESAARGLRRSSSSARRACSTRACRTSRQLEAAELAVKTREAQIDSAEKQLVQADANLDAGEAERRATRRSTRRSTASSSSATSTCGQTVQASMTTPSFFMMATDLDELEAHGGRRRSRNRQASVRTWKCVHGRRVRPAATFYGTVERRAPERARPATTSSPIRCGSRCRTRTCKLRPSMTAQPAIVISTANDVDARAEPGVALPAERRHLHGARSDAAGGRRAAASCGRRDANRRSERQPRAGGSRCAGAHRRRRARARTRQTAAASRRPAAVRAADGRRSGGQGGAQPVRVGQGGGQQGQGGQGATSGRAGSAGFGQGRRPAPT